MVWAMLYVITHPWSATFDDFRAGANLGAAILAIATSGLISGMIGGWVNLVGAYGSLADMVVLTIMTPLRFVIAFLVVQAFMLAAARSLGGRGEFETQAYLAALAFAPLYAAASLVAAIPTIGGWLVLLILGYIVTLMAVALQSAHGGEEWRVPRGVLWAISFFGGLIGTLVISILPQ